MNRKLFLVFFFFLIILLVLQGVSAKTINCKKDIDCFIEQSKECNRSKVEFNQNFGFFGIFNFSIIDNMNMKKEKTGECRLFIQRKMIKIHLGEYVIQNLTAEGYSLREIKMIERKANSELKKVYTGRSRGVCLFNNSSDLTE